MSHTEVDVLGAPVRIGDRVKVILAADDTFDDKFMGLTGFVVHLDYECGCGQTYPGDPMIGVRFDDQSVEEFWKEELQMLTGK